MDNASRQQEDSQREMVSTNCRDGDRAFNDELMQSVYQELRELAARYMSNERVGHTLAPTVLVHEVYLRLVGEQLPEIKSRAHLLGLCARLMKQILINHAKARATLKRGGEFSRVPLDDALSELECHGVDVLELNELLDRLAQQDPMLVRVVELRFFGGLTIDETAEVLGISPRKVVSHWTFARAWLRKESFYGKQ